MIRMPMYIQWLLTSVILLNLLTEIFIGSFLKSILEVLRVQLRLKQNLLNSHTDYPGIIVSGRNLSCLKFLFLLLGLSCALPAFNQIFSIVLKDKISGQPIGFAHVMIKSINDQSEKSTLSNEKGELELSESPPIYISVSSIGYKLYSDTITTKGQHDILLSPEYYQLDNVVVTGQFRPQVVDKSIYKINVIDNRQLKFKIANNLDELLKNELSFQYRYEGTLGNMLSIRGLTGEYIKVLIDGLPVTGREEGFIDLSQISLNNVDHIEILEGPMSVVYGSNAFAGAINIITSDYSKTNLFAHINAHYETVGIYNFDGSFGKSFKNHSISFNLARNFYSDWSPSDSSRSQIIKPKLQYIAGTTYRYSKKMFRLSFVSTYINEELRDLGALTYDGKALDSYFYTTRLNNNLNLSNTYNHNFVINLQAGYSLYRKKKITYQNDLVNLEKFIVENSELLDTTTFHLISARGFVSNIPGKRFEYQSGFEYSYEFANGKRMQGFHDISDAAGFLNFIYRPYPIISLQPGVRFIYNSKYKAPLVYALNLKINPGAFIFRGSYAKGFSAPSLKQLYLQFIDSNHEIFGNEDLKSETANNFNLSGNYLVSFEKHSVSFEIDLFYNSINNAIQLAIDTERPGWGKYFNVNGDDYKTKGLEATLNYNYSQNITVNTGVIITGVSTLNKQSNFYYSRDIVSSVVYHNSKYNYEFAVYYRYSGKSVDFAGNFDSNQELIGIAQRSIDDYHTMDISLSKNLYKEKLMVSGGVKNLFDVTMVNSQGNINFHGGSGNSIATGYGRSYFIKFSFLFDKY
jgi:outer membrane receptor for ferrienterochelin and colicins